MMTLRNTVTSILIMWATLSKAFGWLYTLPDGSCSSFSTCQSCVVEFAWDVNVRRPCTWCPSTNSCQMMNHYSEYCPQGETFRETCPIVTTDLPECVVLNYSFWTCASGRPRNADQCDAAFANDFCVQKANNREFELCNGDVYVLEYAETGWGTMDALVVKKNPYGLDISLEYFWYNPGYGEDRRRIETKLSDTYSWLCNADVEIDQAMVLKYRVQQPSTDIPEPLPLPSDTDPPTPDPLSTTNGDEENTDSAAASKRNVGLSVIGGVVGFLAL